MIWGKFPASDSKHSCSALQARGVREWNTWHLYLMISIYQQEQSQDVGSDLIPCSPVFTWGTHAHVCSSPCHYHTPFLSLHICTLIITNNFLTVQFSVCFTCFTARTRRLWCSGDDGEVSGGVFTSKNTLGHNPTWWISHLCTENCITEKVMTQLYCREP